MCRFPIRPRLGLADLHVDGRPGMHARRRWLAQTVVLTLCLAGVVAANRRLDEPVDPPLTAYEALPSELYVRLLGKLLVGADAAFGRLGLLEAAARFRALNELTSGPPPSQAFLEMRWWSKHLPSRSEDEQLCLLVIGYVAGLSDDVLAGGSAAAVERLETEYSAALRQGDAIRLPFVPPAAVEELIERARRELNRTRLGPLAEPARQAAAKSEPCPS